jgi:hypothetical protein
LVTWAPVPDAVEYFVYNADTLYFVGSVTDPVCAIYGMQGVLYHHYVVAVDSTGATSTPSNIVNTQTSAPVPPAPPSGFAIVPSTVFGVQTSTAPAGDLLVKVPYDTDYITGSPADLKLMQFTENGWVDVTTSVDTTRSFVSGMASLSSVFAVMQPDGSVVQPVVPPVTPPVVSPPPVEPPLATPPVVTPPPATVVSTPAASVTLVTRTRITTPARATIGRKLTAAGKVWPAPAIGSATIVTARLVNHHWIGARSARVTVRNGSYRFAFTPRKRGQWRLVATFTGREIGTTTYTRSAVSVRRVTVK